MLGGGGIAIVALALALAPRTSTIEGVVVAVDAVSPAEVNGFTLRVAGGELAEFRLGPLENALEFPPGHLAEHVGTSVPVVVTYREEGGRRIALRLVDAPGPGGGSPPTR